MMNNGSTIILSKPRWNFIFIYFLLLLAIVVISNKFVLLFFPLYLSFIYFNLKNNEENLYLTIILILMTPLSLLKPYYTFVFDFPQMFIFGYLFTRLFFRIKKIIYNLKIKMNFTFITILQCIIIVYIMFDFVLRNNNLGVKFQEIRIFLISFFIFYSFYKNNEITINKFYSLTLRGITFASIITLILYFLPNVCSISLIDIEGRYSWGYQTLYIVTIPLLIYKLILENSKRKTLFLFCSLFIQIVNLFLGGNRTGFLLILIISLYMIMKSMILLLKKREKQLRVGVLIFLSIIIMALSLFIVSKLINIEGNIIYRLNEIFVNNGENNIQTLDARSVTNNYYLATLIKEPLGNGIGSLMYMYTPNYNPYGLRSFIDNAFLSFGYKFGLIMLFNLMLIIISSIYKILKKIKYNFYFLYSFVISIALIISAGILTAQIFNNNAVNLFFWGLLGIGMNDKKL